MEGRGQAQASFQPGLWPVEATASPKSGLTILCQRPYSLLNVNVAMGTNLPPSNPALIWPWEPGTNDKVTNTRFCAYHFTCSAQWMPKSRVFLGNFKVRPLWRDIAHSNFRVRYWKGMVFFVIYPIPISSSFLAQPQGPGCFINWHTWGRAMDTSGHGSCLSQDQRWGSLPSDVP